MDEGWSNNPANAIHDGSSSIRDTIQGERGKGIRPYRDAKRGERLAGEEGQLASHSVMALAGEKVDAK